MNQTITPQPQSSSNPRACRTTFSATILGLAILSVSPAQGAVIEWTGTGSEFWTNGANWNGFSQPGATDTADFSTSSPFVLRTGVNLSENRTIARFIVRGNHFSLGAYSFSRINGAVLAVSGATELGFPATTTSTTTFNGFLLNTNQLFVQGQMTATITGSASITTTGALNTNNSSVLNLSGGSLNLAANTSHNLNDSSTLNVNGGTLNLGANATLNANATSTLNFSAGYNVTNNTLLRAQGGGDILGTSFIDVGNGGIGFLTVNQAGSTITAQSNTSDWGLGSTGSAVVDIFTGGTTSVSALRLGTSDAQASLNVAGGTLNVNSTFQAGGGAVSRSVQTTVQDSGTMTVNGAATFNNQADVNLISGTLDFNNSATFNAGSRIDITGGTLDTTNQSLTINGGTLTRSTSGALSSGSALGVQAGGTATFSDYFDIGNGNSAALTVTGAGSTFTAGGTTDWGFGSGGATVSIDNNGVANFNSLRIGNGNGTASVTVASGGQLKPNVLTVGGGSNIRTVNLTINGGTVTTLDAGASNTFNDKAVLNLQSGTFDPKGNVTFFTGSTANWSGGSFLIASGKTLAVSGGVINRTITTAGGLSPGATLAISSAGRFESVGNYSLGESGGGTTTVTGTGSRFTVNGNLTLGQVAGGSAGTLTISADGRLNVGDTAASNVVGAFSFIEDASTDPNEGGVLTVYAGSTLNNNNTGNAGLSIGRGIGRRGTVIVSGAGATINDNATFIGFQGNGTLTINGGGKHIANSADFATSGGTATVSVDGPGSLLWSKSNLNLGSATFGGSCTLTTTSSGRLFVGDAAGEAGFGVAVADGDPIGSNGGVLTINNGCTLTSADGALIGAFSSPGATKSGRVVVSGTNSVWNSTSGSLQVGYNGTGELNIQSGGRVTCSVNVFTSSFGGTGSITIASGGRLGSAFQVVLADTAGTSSSATVTGTNSTIAVGTLLEVGRAGNGTLNIQAGGRVNAASAIVGRDANSVGTIHLAGASSTLAVTTLLEVGGGGTGTLKGTGAITGNLAFGSNGKYAVEVNGALGTSDQIIVTGTVTLNTAATLTANVTGTPAVGQKYFILVNDDMGPTVGNFAGLPQGALVGTFGGIGLRISYTGESGSNTITGGNDIVLYAGTPYDAWSGGAPFDGDANGDGVSNGLAFLLGAPNPNALALGLLPTVTEDGGGLVLTFDMLNAAARGDATLSVEHSSDLGVGDLWTTVAVPNATGGPTGGVTFTITGSDPLEVTATISASQAASGKLFGRLKAVNP
jgi:fibronectin-binding autotransporter adhesin